MPGIRNQDDYGTYGSVPTSEPEGPRRVEPRLNVQANPNDFGAQVGGSLEKLGNTGEQIGDQINQYAIKLGDIYNQSSARDGVVSASQDLSDAENEFKQNKGNNAVAALKVFQQKAADINNQYAASMPTNGANLLFKNDFSKEVSGAIFRSGDYAAQQAEQAHISSMTSSISNNINQYAMNADNPTGPQYLQGIAKTQSDLSDALGHDPETKQAAISQSLGLAGSAAIKTMIQTNPDGAKKLYDQFSNSTLNYEDTDKDGNIVQHQIPYLDAQQRANVSSEMGGEFRRQFGEQLQTARMYAASGVDYDHNAFVASAKNAGHNDDYINAETMRLDQLASKANVVSNQYGVEKSLKDAEAMASAGRPVTNIPSPDVIRAAYPKNPEKAQDVMNEFAAQVHVAGFVAGLPTTPLSQIETKLNEFAPKDNGSTLSIADAIHQQESGGRSNVPAGGPSVGGWQITPATFALHQKQGEDIFNPADNEAVGRRIIDGYSKQYGGDPARIATAYFSGPGNVAPAGSPTPWIRDTQDANGKSVSSYVADIQGRMQGSGFAEQASTYNKMQKATANYLKNLSDDPAGTIVQNDQNLNTLLNNAIKDPTKMGDYVDAIKTRQDLLEIPEGNRSVLPVQTATAMTQSITSNPEGAPAQLAKMASDYGSNWPGVYKSLVQQGGLNTKYQLIEHSGEDPQYAQYGTMYARYGSDDDTKNKTDEVLMGGAEPLRTIKDGVSGNASLLQLTESLKRSGSSPQQISDFIGNVQKMAMAIHFYDTSQAGRDGAAAKAVEVATSGYGFMPGYQGGARVPSAKLDDVTNNAAATISNIDNIMSPAQFVPNTYANRQQYIDDVKSSPTWITDEVNGKIVLADHFGRPVMGKDGKQISVGFNDPAMPYNIKTEDKSFGTRLGDSLEGMSN